MVRRLFPAQTTSFFHTSLLPVILSISNPRFQHVAVAKGKTQNHEFGIFYLEGPFSKCCCGHHGAQNFDLHHHGSTFVTIKIIKTTTRKCTNIGMSSFCRRAPIVRFGEIPQQIAACLECLILYVSIYFFKLLVPLNH